MSIRMLGKVRGNKRWEPPQLIDVVLKHSATCRVCDRVLSVGDHALHMTWGVEYACHLCGWWRTEELGIHLAWLAMFGCAPMTDVRARWLELQGYVTVDQRKLAWTALGAKRRDKWLASRGP